MLAPLEAFRPSIERSRAASCSCWPASRWAVNATSSALNRKNSSSIFRRPVSVSLTRTSLPSSAVLERRTWPRPSSVVTSPVDRRPRQPVVREDRSPGAAMVPRMGMSSPMGDHRSVAIGWWRCTLVGGGDDDDADCDRRTALPGAHRGCRDRKARGPHQGLLSAETIAHSEALTSRALTPLLGEPRRLGPRGLVGESAAIPWPRQRCIRPTGSLAGLED